MIAETKFCHLGPDFQTFITNRAATTPDLILNNNKQVHNIHIKPGKITTSDHLPIAVTLSANPIQVPTTPTLDLKHADWETFKRELSLIPPLNLDRRPTTTINTNMNEWFNDIKSAMNNNIPTRSHKILPHPTITPEITALKNRFNALVNDPLRMRWTLAQREEYTQLQAELQEAYKVARNTMWEGLLTQIETDKRDPKKFWSGIKRLMGTSTSEKTHILDENGGKKYEAYEKEQLFRKHWENVFKISPEENLNFCQQKEQEVLEELADNADKFEPYETIDFARLQQHDPLIRPISNTEVKNTLKSFKNRKAPGESKITKEILQNIPENMLTNLTMIYNASLSSGIFPKAFKHAIIKMINKAGKTPTLVINYRPISLLETAGKVYEKIINRRLRNLME